LIRGYAAEGLQWHQEILDLPSLPPAAELRALEGATVLWYTQGELERARTGLARALELSRAADMDAAVRLEDLFARIEHACGNFNAARDRFAVAVEGFRSRAIPWGHGNALSGMASVALATGDAVQAERLLDEAMPVFRQAGPWFLTWGLYLRAIVAVRRGNADEAIALVRESLTFIRDLQDKYAFAYTLVPLVAAAVLKGDDAWAARILGARDSVSERTGATVVLKLVHDLQEQSQREVRARLGPDRWAVAYGAGRRTTFDALLKDIDHVLRGR
jgi:tetratricopeptide (TPR) repeat protein